ncbi:MAG: hypothetical protein HY611_09295 [Elusimicrobia bacterium]|nr:hypothetical protein [Elusimicrobiota bacterium]
MRISFLILACLCGPAFAEPEIGQNFSNAERRLSLFHRSGPCPGSRLSLGCGPTPHSWIDFKPPGPRYPQNALTIRFSDDKRRSSKIEVQIGNFLSQALSVAAVVVTFLL